MASFDAADQDRGRFLTVRNQTPVTSIFPNLLRPGIPWFEIPDFRTLLPCPANRGAAQVSTPKDAHPRGPFNVLEGPLCIEFFQGPRPPSN
jgi:hypothetical protein